MDEVIGRRRDYRAAMHLIKTVGVTPIPPSAFYSSQFRDSGIADNLLRFAYCKTDAELEQAVGRLTEDAKT